MIHRIQGMIEQPNHRKSRNNTFLSVPVWLYSVGSVPCNCSLVSSIWWGTWSLITPTFYILQFGYQDSTSFFLSFSIPVRRCLGYVLNPEEINCGQRTGNMKEHAIFPQVLQGLSWQRNSVVNCIIAPNYLLLTFHVYVTWSFPSLWKEYISPLHWGWA